LSVKIFVQYAASFSVPFIWSCLWYDQ